MIYKAEFSKFSIVSLPDVKIEKNFRLSEFASKCGSSEIKLNLLLVEKLQLLRDRVNEVRKKRGLREVGIRINSGYRTEQHNKAVGGHSESLHTKGTAVDISIDHNVDEVVRMALELFQGIGVYSWGLHLDLGESKVWYQR